MELRGGGGVWRGCEAEQERGGKVIEKEERKKKS